jgi:phosphatidylinositol 3,5-bisphosphate 5-phosphatase
MSEEKLERGDEPSLHSFPGDNNQAETDESSPPPLLHSSISTLESTSFKSASVPASLSGVAATSKQTSLEGLGQRPSILTSASANNIPTLQIDPLQGSSSSPTTRRASKGEAPFPQLLNNPPSTPHPKSHFEYFDDRYDESGVPYGFERTPIHPSRKRDTRSNERVAEEAIHRMHKYTLYETAHRFYIVGSDLADTTSRILKIDRTADDGELSVVEDDVEYTRAEMNGLLATIEDGNKSTGGLKVKMHFWGVLGFIRFTGPYYMLLITKRSIVGVIGGHYIYQVRRLPFGSTTTN